METSDIAQIIRDRAAANGVDPATLLRFGQVESGLDPNASASGSSAKGLFQFTNPTWQAFGNGGDPLDPVANADAAARLMKANAAGLASAGLDTSPGSLYLAHFAGLGGAQKLLTADPNQPAGDVLGAAAVKANPFLARMTVGDVRAWASGKMGAAAPTGVQASPSTANPVQPAQPMNVATAGATPTDGTDAALTVLRNIYQRQLQEDALPVPQMNLLRAIVRPRTVYLGKTA